MSKSPLIHGGFHSATDDEHQIADWWSKYPDANIGLAMPENICILDIDSKDVEIFLGNIPETVTSLTPRKEVGYHYWFQLPEGLKLDRKIQVLDKVDILPGGTGYVIVPNSIHPNGGRYAWKRAITKHQIAAAPDWLIDLALRPPQDSESTFSHGAVDPARILSGVNEGSRNVELFRFACWLRAHNTDYNIAKLALEEAIANCNPPYTDQSSDYILSRVYSKYQPNYAEQNKKRGYTLKELMETDFDEPNWFIEEILPEGFCLFSGDPKLGKSLLINNLALSVALGEQALRNFRTNKRGALVLDLELGTELSKKRWTRVLNGHMPPENLHLYYKWERMDEGGLDEIRKFLDLHTDIGFVIIDVLAKFRPIKELVEGTAYQKDYAFVSKLADLAREYHVAIVGVHHKSKDDYGDFLKSASGSMGMTAASDTVWSLDRDRSANIAHLNVTGKNVRDNRIPLLSYEEGFRWSVYGK